MYMDYCFYLNKLEETQKNKQILIFMLFWVGMVALAMILQSIYDKRHKECNKIKE